ncbi:TlpA family protein disulfide reductase [Marinobacter bryozoorum]|jgi:thiol-disulfide isomerase/thioredoxin|uniref:TlpA family protein disulfide reductase n=1 Tax=Marinobacter bryozoorum TaxID=256324 RepID=UPI002004DE51|nr:TlpA disulfide reductase family protein [Marinobacter bryozoorum]MCK7543284.1 TlpA family protein disulfide reductase [Marinobacter bryozoorum]
MGKYPVVVAVAFAAVLAGCGESTSSSSPAAKEFPTASGDTLPWDSLRGRWVLVNYWAEWCKPCLEEIPELNEVDSLENVTVLGVNYDGVAGEALVELGDRMGIGFTMLANDPAPELGWEVPGGLPATFVVAPDGSLSDTLMGAQTEADLKAAIGQD